MTRDYQTVARRVRARLRPQDGRQRRMQAVVDCLWEDLRDHGVSWVGFYLKAPDGASLALGPRRDGPACSPIGLHGACGQALRSGRALVVRDVRSLGDNYIACDPRDRSEIVVPAGEGPSEPFGVLDLDSHDPGAFDEGDAAGLGEVLAAAGFRAGDA